MSKKSLGKGLSALIGSITLETQNTNDVNKLNTPVENFSMIRISQVELNPNQPRKNFDEKKLNELADSISENNVITPITVRRVGDKFELISGERRLRASQKANKITIPAYIIDSTDEESHIISIIENIQRENLSPIEEAESYSNLINKFNYTQDDLSKKIGKSRSHIANLLRLLNLPKNIQKSISEGQITTGHAKLLSQFNNPNDVSKMIIDKKMSVRDVEKILKSEKDDLDTINEIKRMESIMREKFYINPTIEHKNGSYKIIFECKNSIELENFIKNIINLDLSDIEL